MVSGKGSEHKRTESEVTGMKSVFAEVGSLLPGKKSRSQEQKVPLQEWNATTLEYEASPLERKVHPQEWKVRSRKKEARSRKKEVNP